MKKKISESWCLLYNSDWQSSQYVAALKDAGAFCVSIWFKKNLTQYFFGKKSKKKNYAMCLQHEYIYILHEHIKEFYVFIN